MNTNSKNNPEPKRVFFISKHASWQDYRNEVLTYIGRLYDAKVEILTTGTLQHYISSNETVSYKFFRSWLPLHAAKVGLFPGAVLHIIKSRPDVVLCQNDTLQFTEYLAFLVCKIMGIRFVWWTHAHMPSVIYTSRFKKWLRQKYALFFLKKGDAVVSYCRVGEKFLLDNKVDSEKVFCAPNTLNTEKLIGFATSMRQSFSKQELRQCFGLPPDRKYILFMGRLTVRKRVEIAIQIVHQLNMQKKNEYHLIIIGDGENRRSLESLAANMAPDNVTFTGAVFDQALKARYFSLADLFIIPGAVGLAIVHAFCFRLPIVTTASGNHGPEIIYLENWKNGVMVHQNDNDMIASVIKRLFEDKDNLLTMGKRAEATIEKQASIETMAEQLAKALAL
ncbi:MAG: glycosyltransferase [Calditrichaeota bacterium]|nr:MAG: glycosyltransferase [Calditrichota bacterium]